MNCQYCGSENPDGAQQCTTCGQPLGGTSAEPAAPESAPQAMPAPPAPPTYAPPQYAAPPQPPAPPVAPPPGAYSPGAYSAPPPIKNHLVFAILATLFCCLPFGVVGIIFASQVSSKLAVGDYAGAQRASKNASLWSWLAVGAGLIIVVVYVALIALGVMGQVGSEALSSY